MQGSCWWPRASSRSYVSSPDQQRMSCGREELNRLAARYPTGYRPGVALVGGCGSSVLSSAALGGRAGTRQAGPRVARRGEARRLRAPASTTVAIYPPTWPRACIHPLIRGRHDRHVAVTRGNGNLQDIIAFSGRHAAQPSGSE